MKIVPFVLSGALVAEVLSWPGMDKTMTELKAQLAARDVPDPEPEMIGDLKTKGAHSNVGRAIHNILRGKADPYSDVAYAGVLPPKGSAACAADTCCIWKYIAQDMQQKFRTDLGPCNNFARGAVRLGFHDAAAWSKTSGYGGADGSIVLAHEIARPENHGLEEIIEVVQGWYDVYHKYGVGMADLIQMGATVATVTCPLGPRIRSFVGRKDSSKPGPMGLLPNVSSDADTLIKLFRDKTIFPSGLAALVGAHTISAQRFVNTSRALDPQDSTPGVWDTKFYGETLTPKTTAKGVFMFPSDLLLSSHKQTTTKWHGFAKTNGQAVWNEYYSKEYVRLSLLGVNNINELTECTKVLPPAIKSFIDPAALH